ncbi:hypothetical protein ACOJQI_10230 [Bacillus salacetis]|uniref:hypothetical protein n=1 Tax=Bacillus salacetis TaxID=2315464 RepID=UPI003BA03A60
MQFNAMEKEQFHSVNDIHDEALVDHFRNGKGRRVFMLLQSYPFIFIGTIEDISDDMVVLQVETSQFPALENRQWHVHIHNIEVFYIERSVGPRIPKLKD